MFFLLSQKLSKGKSPFIHLVLIIIIYLAQIFKLFFFFSLSIYCIRAALLNKILSDEAFLLI